MRENCLQDRSEWHHVPLPVRRLHPWLCRWLCSLIRSAAGPGASVGPCVPNRSRTINNSHISCGGLSSDVVRRTSVQGRVRTSEPGLCGFGRLPQADRHRCAGFFQTSWIWMGCLHVEGTGQDGSSYGRLHSYAAVVSSIWPLYRFYCSGYVDVSFCAREILRGLGF